MVSPLPPHDSHCRRGKELLDSRADVLQLDIDLNKERGGCDVIATSKASRLFGVFSWSEIGFGYFGVSLVTLLLYPHLWPALAACNILCLPYTVWSLTYQKFVARHWCTLCVGVQLTLWALFLCWLAGGWVAKIFPLHADLFVLMGVYIAAVLSINLCCAPHPVSPRSALRDGGKRSFRPRGL